MEEMAILQISISHSIQNHSVYINKHS